MKTLLLVIAFSVVASLNTQSQNLLQNPNADNGAQSWRGSGEVSVETTSENGPCFVVRNGGRFIQDIELPRDAAGQYAVLIGRGASERINADGAITDLPALYGYMMQPP